MTDSLVWGVPSFWIERLPLYYGRSKGFFQNKGIELKIKYYWGGLELAQAVDRGEAAIGNLGLPPFLMAVAQGLPLRAIGSSIMQQLNHHLVARPGVERLEDLRGKRVGILSFGSCDDFFLRYMLESSDVNLEQVEMVPLGRSYGDLECFASGRIEAGFVSEPYVALGEEQGLLKVLASVKTFFPRYQWGVFLARDAFIDENADLIHRALEAYRESCRAIKADPEEAGSLGAQVFRMKKEIFRRALYRDLDSWEIEARIDLEGLKNGVEVQRQIGAIPSEFDLEGVVRQF
jgi:ABC-type nitrate/sulfonate/bicarbonate transport system substrate-binding protein